MGVATSVHSGTVTFLLTDIEGTTRLREQYPEPMRTALARHDALLCAAIEAHGGHVFKTMGDQFCAAFATAPDALTAALEAQRLLQTESWDQVSRLPVRMALHTGVAELRGGDCFGAPLNRAARLLAAGHGVRRRDLGPFGVDSAAGSSAPAPSPGRHPDPRSAFPSARGRRRLRPAGTRGVGGERRPSKGRGGNR